jgi:hypothetical protein
LFLSSNNRPFSIKNGELAVDQNSSNPAMEYQDMDEAVIQAIVVGDKNSKRTECTGRENNFILDGISAPPIASLPLDTFTRHLASFFHQVCFPGLYL